MTITLGWWLLPLLISLAAPGAVIWAANRPEHMRGFIPTGMFVVLFWGPVSIVAALAAWLIWALAT